MKIALDYDKTYTLDPAFWDKVILLAKHSGHSVTIATMRYPHETIENPPVDVVYTSRQAKMKFIRPDVWIDDQPGWIFEDAIV